ncbi:hypothetical protein [Vibrio brasiliensis]|uniref:Uncharacterized protein n=1 Tax=Vibrio brasiliensis LMG 20546 TaxID=945543 RepID=E8LX17_9VIBR|nr:hypothetical protein [Vibrio brasiliensis]EGA64918.1 hypothetical protein VIBR0546_17848 [Vibrio brasiliensis LMG 20546]
MVDFKGKEAIRLGCTPCGEVYRKNNDKAFWKKNDTVNANTLVS